MDERLIVNQRVAGSNPALSAKSVDLFKRSALTEDGMNPNAALVLGVIRSG
jgi:hypothetical protein